MKRILFVDAEVGVLEGLRNALWRQRAQWDMTFARSGAEALAQLQLQPFDAIVTDLHMPGMDGPQLLTQVRERHPQVVRVSLSGEIDEDVFVRAVPVTHQFLTKPCSPDKLCETVERACGLRAILENETVRALLGQLDQLPSTPSIFNELSRVIAHPTARTNDITEIVSRDTALSVKILQIVNSAFFNLTQPVKSIHAAVNYLGMEMIKALALSACIFCSLDAASAARTLLEDLQSRSRRKAQLARALMSGSRHADEAFTAALLLDIGQVVLALKSADRFGQVIGHARNRQRPQLELEQEAFGVSHPEVGACLLSLWGLPLELIEVVAYHHHPSGVEHAHTQMLTAVCVADAIIDASTDNTRLLEQLDSAFVERAEVARRLQEWHLDAASTAATARASFATLGTVL